MTILQDVRTQAAKEDSWSEECMNQVEFIEARLQAPWGTEGGTWQLWNEWLEDQRDSLFEDRSNMGGDD